uniref:Uncharacterized protein n=1 Tax=Salix viminalis TaxID=40686 RepID=A0A6N2MKX0_SALVM
MKKAFLELTLNIISMRMLAGKRYILWRQCFLCGRSTRVLLSLKKTEPEYYTDDIIKGASAGEIWAPYSILGIITRCKNTTIFMDHQKIAWLEGSASHVALCYL